MKKWLSIVIVLAAILLQALLVDRFRFFSAKPDLLIAVLVIMTGIFLFQLSWLLVLAFILGLSRDILSANVSTGIYTLLFCCWAVLIVRISKKVSIDDNLRRAALVLGIVLLDAIAVRVISIFCGNPLPWGVFFRICFIGSLYTALVSLLLMKMPFFRVLKA